jgi:U4/U6 small nuclear ribonucleoprotein PRP4
MVTSSYDSSARIWTSPDCAPLKTLKGHDGKVMSVDASPGT